MRLIIRNLKRFHLSLTEDQMPYPGRWHGLQTVCRRNPSRKEICFFLTPILLISWAKGVRSCAARQVALRSCTSLTCWAIRLSVAFVCSGCWECKDLVLVWNEILLFSLVAFRDNHLVLSKKQRGLVWLIMSNEYMELLAPMYDWTAIKLEFGTLDTINILLTYSSYFRV